MVKKRGGRRGKGSKPGEEEAPSQPETIQPQPGPSQPQPGPSQPQRGPSQPQRGPSQPQRGPFQPQPGSSQPQPGPSQPKPVVPRQEPPPQWQKQPPKPEERTAPSVVQQPSEPKPGPFTRPAQPAAPSTQRQKQPPRFEQRPRPSEPKHGPPTPERQTQPPKVETKPPTEVQEPPKPLSGPPVQKLSIAQVAQQTPFKPGTLGRRINIETNHLQLNLGNLRQVYRYDVAVVPDKPKRMLRQAMAVFRQRHYPNNHPSYDGQKLLFSAKRLPFENDTISGAVTIKDDSERDKEFKITIKLTGIIDLSSVNNLLQKNVNQDEAFQCIEIVFRQAYVSSFISVGRRFFTPMRRSYTVGNGAEMYLGGYQAAVKGWTTLLNVDVAHKAFTMAISLKDLILEMFSTARQQMTEESLKYPLQRWQIEQLSKYLEGLKLVYQIPNHPGSKKTYRINSLEGPPSKESFDYNGQRTTIETYYKSKWHYNLRYPNLPCVWVGNKTKKILLPLECCSLQEGQPIDGNKMSDTQTSAMIKYAATSTTERKKKIQNIIQMAGYNRNPCIQEFGFSISDEFLKVDGRVLDPPALQYSGGTVEPFKGTWRGRKFIKSGHIQKWTIVAVDTRREHVNEGVNQLARNLQEFGYKSGIMFPKPEPFDFIRGDYRSIVQYLESKKYCDLIFVIVPPFKKEIYYLVKQAAELTVGCLTQCIKADTLRKLRESTISNILLKVNCKLNGTNHILRDLNLISGEPCMVMGADVTHPSPQARTIPSVVAVTASHDLTATNYNVCVRIQKARTEMIQDLENITLTKLHRFFAGTKRDPTKIYFFRDGVSDGEFDKVKHVEIQAIRRACESYKRGYRPKITFLVVQKRHHTRLFPLDQSATDGDKNFNVPAGTCVDEMIVDPTIQNFFLVSHASIQGVARPTKYCTLYDDNGLSNDDVQKLTYYLCHVFTRCNRAVSYPAPTYYAHLAADRAKGYLWGKTVNMEQLDPRLVKINDNFITRNPMFFS